MISLILYGRNDSYGYNLHKRAALSLNAFSEVLNAPDDEIIFVDYNTDNDIPTFPEAIRDTLSPKVQSMMRIVRVRPYIHELYRGDSWLVMNEPLARNIGVRHTSPDNRWILSTNTDMVFVPKNGKTLSEIADSLEDGYYAMPRFEMPETLWEGLDRTDPATVINQFETWGKELRLNEIVRTHPEQLFDGPGDFQLFPRQALFDIDGFNQEMIYPWHIDSNICKRFYLFYGESKSLEHEMTAYHCDHTRVVTPAHGKSRIENDLGKFFYDVKDAYLPDQRGVWGAVDEEFEVITFKDTNAYHSLTRDMLQNTPETVPDAAYTYLSYGDNLYYNFAHAFPYIMDNFSCVEKDTAIAYVGDNADSAEKMNEFLKRSDIIVPLTAYTPNEVNDDTLAQMNPDVWVYDMYCDKTTAVTTQDGFSVLGVNSETLRLIITRFHTLLQIAAKEQRSIAAGNPPKKFMVLGLQNSIFELLTDKILGLIAVPYSCHFRHGFVREDVDIETPLAIFSQLAALSDKDLQHLSTYIQEYTNVPNDTVHFKTAFTGVQEAVDANPGEEAPILAALLMYAIIGFFQLVPIFYAQLLILRTGDNTGFSRKD